MLALIGRNILTGMVTILPFVLTFYLLYWLAVSAESLLGGWIRSLMPQESYWPGMGVLAGVFALFLVGVLMHAYIGKWLFAKLEALFSYMPVVKPIFRAMKDFFDYFSPDKKQEFEQVVAVTIGEMKLVGFVTQNRMETLPKGLGDADTVLVYLPLSYMIGGYAVLVPRGAVTPLDMSMDEAMRFTLTAGVTKLPAKEHD